ncbi:hypothetical protein MPER_07482, partial [Moniliophthora perniciosa FA553]
MLALSNRFFSQIHRCYVIWSSRKRVILPLIAAAVLTNIFGVAGAIMLTISVSDPSMSLNRLYFIGNNVNFAHSVASLVVNFTLTLLTAGRIWWIHRQVRALGVSASDTLVQSVSKIILESGSPLSNHEHNRFDHDEYDTPWCVAVRLFPIGGLERWNCSNVDYGPRETWQECRNPAGPGVGHSLYQSTSTPGRHLFQISDSSVFSRKYQRGAGGHW